MGDSLYPTELRALRHGRTRTRDLVVNVVPSAFAKTYFFSSGDKFEREFRLSYSIKRGLRTPPPVCTGALPAADCFGDVIPFGIRLSV